MDVERALVTAALRTGRLVDVTGRGIESEHFTERPTTEPATPAQVYQWAVEYMRRFGCPDLQITKVNWPEWRDEPSTLTLEAIIDEFLNYTRWRIFNITVQRLARLGHDMRERPNLDQHMLEAARELLASVPSGSVGWLGAEMPSRVTEYEIDEQVGHKPGLSMGIPLFDDLTYGVRPGKVYVISGFSGKGKSSIGSWIMTNMAEQDANGLILSLEMSRGELLELMDTMIMNFSNRAFQRRELDRDTIDDWRKVAGVYSRAKNDIAVVDNLSGASFDRIAAEIQRYKPDVTLIDYIQRLKGPSRQAKHEYLDEVVNEFKTIAMNTNSAIIVCSQDNRSAADEGSTVTSAAGSIGIYQAADVYIGLRQTDVQRDRNELELMLLKNRGGAGAQQAHAHLRWNYDQMEFLPWADVDQFRKQDDPK